MESVDLRLMQSAIQNLVDGFIVIDKFGTVQAINPAVHQLFGYEFEELIGENIRMLMPEPDRGKHDSYLSNYLTTGIAKIIGVGREVMGKRKNGETFPIELAISKVVIEEKILFVGILRDITERKEAEKRQQLSLIMEMSTPIMRLWNQILLLPLIGVIDSKRAQSIMDFTLQSIQDNNARVIVMDIQGVPNVDSAVANHILKITKATKLLGCDCLVTGISPEVSQTLVNLGIDLDSVLTRANLVDGLAYAFEVVGVQVKNLKV